MTISKSFSKSITISRFLLCFLVVVIHSRLLDDGITISPWLYNFQYSISLILCSIAVPIFLFYSGYLLFQKYSNSTSINECYLSTLKKRWRSLLVPYILWNVIGYVYIILKQHIGLDVVIPNIFEVFTAVPRVNAPQLFPADGPLWFVRDLIILNIVCPILYYLFKIAPKILLVVSLMAYILFGFPDFYSADLTVPFFCFGALCAMNRIDVSNCHLKFWDFLISGCFILIFIVIIYLFINDKDISFLARILYITAIVLVSRISLWIDNNTFCKLLERLSIYSFFIYASHVFIIEVVKRISVNIYSVFVYDNDIIIGLSYLTIPLFTITICLGMALLLKKYIPCLFCLLNGTR